MQDTEFSGRGKNPALHTNAALLIRMKDPQDNDAWAEFDRRYLGVMLGFVRSLGACSEQEAEEIVQDTRIRMFRAMPGFEYRPEHGLFRNFLFSQIKYARLDFVRSRSKWSRRHSSLEGHESPEGRELIETLEDNAAEIPDQILETKWREALLRQAKALAWKEMRASERDRKVFLARIEEQRPAQEVMETFGLSRSNLDAILSRIRQKLYPLIKRHLKELEEAGEGAL